MDASTRDLRLSSTSLAREAGVMLGLPYCGTAPDQGALEMRCTSTSVAVDVP